MPTILPFITDNLASLLWLLPELVIAFTIVTVLIGGALLPIQHQLWLRTTAILGLIATLYSMYWLSQQAIPASIPLFNDLLILDSLAIFFRPLFISLTILLLGLRWWQPLATEYTTERLRLIAILSVLLSACLLVMANHWLMLYLSLALLTLATALLIAASTTETQKFEASLKYLLSSVVLSAIMLWGISYIYIFTGTFSWSEAALVQGLANLATPATLVFLILALSGLLGLIAAFPYHFWLPDVYQGTAAMTIAYLATVPKVAGVAVFLRLLQFLLAQAGLPFVSHLQTFFALIALLTMLIGNLAALLQSHLQRLMAYATIAQGGLLMAASVACPSSSQAIIHYSLVYSVAYFSALVGIGQLQQITGGQYVRDCSGLGHYRPTLSVCITVALLALIGIPPTAGFSAKLLLLNTLWQGAQANGSALIDALFLTGLLSTILSLYYYLKIPYALFFGKKEGAADWTGKHNGAAYSVVVLLAVLLVVGFFTNSLWLQIP